MMATGIRDEVGSLPAVESVRVDLRDHMQGEEINRVVEGLAFEEALEDPGFGIEAVRGKLDGNAVSLDRSTRSMRFGTRA